MPSTDQARAAAMVTNRPREVWAGAGKDGTIPPLEGAKVADWSAAQQQLLLDAIMLWVGLLDAPSSRARLAEIRAELANTHFAWHGPVDGSGLDLLSYPGAKPHPRVLHPGQPGQRRRPLSFHLTAIPPTNMAEEP